MVDDCNLQDLGFTGGVFTCCNRRGFEDQVSLRLDRLIANSSFCNLFHDYQVTNLDWANSDHRPMELSLEERPRFGSRVRGRLSFKFEEWWTRHEDCRKIISQSGSWKANSPSYPLHHDLNTCAKALGGWDFKKNKRLKVDIRKVKEKIKSTYDGNGPIDFDIIHLLEK